MKKPILFVIDRDLYRAETYVVIGGVEQSAEWILRVFHNFDSDKVMSMVNEEHLGGVLCTQNSSVNILWVKDINNSPVSVSSFLHEVFHLCSVVLRGAGIEHTEQTEEAYAYYLSYMSETILGKYKKSVGAKKRCKSNKPNRRGV